jgi:transcriptional regulator with XRE-family HTH domain
MTHATDTFVGLKLRDARLASKLSQGNVGQHLGISFQQVQKYETAANRVSASKLFEMAKLFQLPVQHFFPEVAA